MLFHNRILTHHLCLFLMASFLLNSQSSFAQSETETITGKLVSLDAKGRNKTLIITTEDGEEKEFLLNSRVPVEVRAKSDESMLVNGFFVKGIINRPNQETLMGKSFVVYPELKGRLPVGTFAKAPPKPGTSKGDYFISGEITGRGPDPDYADFERLLITLSGKNTAPILMKKNISVSISLSDAKYIKPGSLVTVEGTPQRNGRFTITEVTIATDETFTSEDFR
ncbi:hypothetical protein [Rubinisphaera italica]|uniref:DUF5666 domain-containing protein n=1 Tax=Rubinisphaera italica TaxID=2527969 RepID=A0A5C5XJI8_9PLAN|nr:hypothetical protein [Rubinisphaera italica]TWT62275.1 hypothetical protein Pan54_30160 [Rubinisphaera italica]